MVRYRPRRVRVAALCLAVASGAAVAVPVAAANGLHRAPEATRLVSVEDPAVPFLAEAARLSAHGNLVAYTGISFAPTLAAYQVYARDMTTGTTELVSAAPDGAPGNADSLLSAVSGDGRFVVFSSASSNLVPGDTNGVRDVFMREVATQTITRVSVGTGGVQGDRDSALGSVSFDGRYVAFISTAENLVPGDTNGRRDAFVRDLVAGTTERVSVTSREQQARSGGTGAAISGDGQHVSFTANTPDLGPQKSDRRRFSVYVRDLDTGTTELVSVDRDGGLANGRSSDGSPSGDGRFVVFASVASDLADREQGRYQDWDVFVRDRRKDRTERVSVSRSGDEPGRTHSFVEWDSAISLNGRYVAFTSTARDLVRGDTNRTHDAFVRNRRKDATARVSTTAAGGQAPSAFGGAFGTAIAAGGRVIVFSTAGALASEDTDDRRSDVYLRRFR